MSRRGKRRTGLLLECHAVSLLVAFACIAAPATGQRANSQSETIKKARQKLLGPDPQPPAHKSRRDAMLALVRMTEPEAHTVLRDVFAAFGHPAKAPAITVIRLLSILTQEQAFDLAPDKLLELNKNPRLKQRLETYRQYVPSLVQLYAVVANHEKAAEREQIRIGVQDFFTKLPGEVRRPALKLIFANKASKLRAAAIEVAGQTKDPRMAPEIAPLLADKELHGVAQTALQDLTLLVEPFASQKEFDAWWQKNRGKTHFELAIRAAKEARALGKRLAEAYRKKEVELQDKLFARSKRIVELGLAQTPPPWRTLLDEVRDPDLRARNAELLEFFYQQLKARTLDRQALRSTLNDLIQLRDHFDQSYKASPVESRQAILSASTICSTLIGGQSKEAIETRLLDLLGAGGQATDRIEVSRIFDLLKLFPVDRVRQRVLEVLRRPQSKPHLASGLECMRALGLSAEKRLTGQTLVWLEEQVVDRTIANKVREQALEILHEIGINNADVLATLRRLVRKTGADALPEPLRVTALLYAGIGSKSQLQTRTNGDLAKQASAQLAFLRACLFDPAARLRIQAGKALEEFPPSAVNFSKQYLSETAQTIVAEVGTALRDERDPVCVRQFRAILLSQAMRSDVWEAALTQLVTAVRYWAQDKRATTGNGAQSFLEQQLGGVIADLGRLLDGPKKGVQAKATLGLARKLLEVNLHECAGVLLGANVLAQLDRSSGANGGSATDHEAAKQRDSQRRERARQIMKVVHAAGDYDRLATEVRQGIDKLLVSAANGLRANAAEEPLALVLLGKAQLATESFAEASKTLDLFLKQFGKNAPTGTKSTARRLLAKAQMGSGRAGEAAKLLEGHPDFESQTLRGLALQQSRDHANAEKVFAALLANPNLPQAGAPREIVLVGHIESLLAQDKLQRVETALQTFPELTDPQLKDRLALLRSKLAAKKESAKRGGSKPANSKANRPAKPGK